jgi:DNA primase
MDQLEEIKSKIDIVELISSYLPLKKTGRNFKALCPFHSEKTPSFIVSPERQIFKCFGCGEGGDIFKFLMKIENIDFGEAVKELAQRAGVKLTQYRPSNDEKEKQILYEINHLAEEFYHFLLTSHPVGKGALNYVLGRGISQDSIKLFKIGFAPLGWRNLYNFLVSKKGYEAKDLERAGLVIRRETRDLRDERQETKNLSGDYYDRFRGRIMFPLRNHRGYVCGFAGRILESQAKSLSADRQEAKYVNTPETPIYHKSDLLYGLSETKEEIKKKDEVVLVEGEFDMISSYQAGVKNVAAIKGSALTINQIHLLSRFTKNIVLALDQDLAGDQAARRGIEVADEQGMMVKVVKIKGGKDPDEVAQKRPDLWRQLVKEAMPVYDYLIASALARFDKETIEGKRKISEEMIPALARINNEIIKDHYVRLLAEKLGVDQEAIEREIIKWQKSQTTTVFKDEKIKVLPEEKRSRREILEEYLLALGFQSGNWAWLGKRNFISLVKSYRFVRILETLKDYLKRYKTIESNRLAKMLGSELLETFNKLYLIDIGDLLEDEEKLKEEYQKSLLRLEKIDLTEKLSQISDKIKSLEKQKGLTAEEQKKLEKLNEEFRDLSVKLVNFEEEK